MAKSDKKKTGTRGKNRRDAHGVYQRLAERGKAAFRPYDGESAEEFRSAMSIQGVIAIISATETQAAAREITTKIHTEAVNGTDVAAAFLRSRVLQPRI